MKTRIGFLKKSTILASTWQADSKKVHRTVKVMEAETEQWLQGMRGGII